MRKEPEPTYIAEIRIARTNRLLALLVCRAPERPVAQRAVVLHRPRVYGGPRKKKISILLQYVGNCALTVLASGVGGRRAFFSLDLADATTASYLPRHKTYKNFLGILPFLSH